MEVIKLKNLFPNIKIGGTPPRANPKYFGGGLPWVSIRDLGQTNLITATKDTLSEEGVENSNVKLIKKGSLLFSFKLTVGAVAFADMDLYTNEAIAGFEPGNDRIDLRYLYYCLPVQAKKNGRTNNYGAPLLNKEILKEIEIPLPSLEEQKCIVRKLDQADALRQKRKQVIAKLDEYLKSVFLDMFGDPVMNPKKWTIEKFGQIGSLDRGISKHRPRNAKELLGGIHPLIQTGDVANAEMYIMKYESTYSDLGLLQSKKWKKGTLCITIAANIAKTGILDFDACFPDSVVGFIPNPKKTNNIFMHFWMSFFQKILEASAPESAQKNINLKILRDLDVIIPQIELQEKFSEIVRKTEKLKEHMKAQSKQLDDSFNALMQESFK